MADAGGFRFEVEVIADGELSGEGVVVDHDGDVGERGLACFLNGLVEAPAEEGGVVPGAGDAVEDGVEGVVLFGDEDDVADLLGESGLGEGGAVDHAVVFEGAGGHGGEGVVVGGVEDGEDAAEAEELALWDVGAATGTVAEPFEACHGEAAAIGGDGDAVGVPGGGDVAEDFQGCGVEDADSVDAAFGDVEAAAVGGEGHATGADAAEAGG